MIERWYFSSWYFSSEASISSSTKVRAFDRSRKGLLNCIWSTEVGTQVSRLKWPFTYPDVSKSGQSEAEKFSKIFFKNINFARIKLPDVVVFLFFFAFQKIFFFPENQFVRDRRLPKNHFISPQFNLGLETNDTSFKDYLYRYFYFFTLKLLGYIFIFILI